ncbi:MAG TPA: hypothetical protein VGA13_05355 [Acidimicrobiales bacterium]
MNLRVVAWWKYPAVAMVTMLETTVPHRKGAKVRAARDLHGVPEGTPGKVKLINGTHWLRYWVQFENGEWLGSIDHAALVPAGDWEAYLVRRDLEPEDGAELSEEAVVGTGDAGGSGEGLVVDGVVVPQFLLDRAKAARQRLGVD